MKKRALVGVFASLALLLSACGNEAAQPENAVEGVVSEFGLDENGRFIEPRTITVALWDRGHERIPDFSESYWTEWVQERILEEHNIIVEWQTVPRWEEATFQTTQLSAGLGADVGATFNESMVRTISQMGGLLDMYPLLERYGDLLPNLFGLVGEELLYWNLDPVTQELWSLTGRLFQDGRSLTFIREDWLNILDLPVPTTLEEFEATLMAFRDNAALLPGNDNGTVIPYKLGADVTWHASTLFESLVPSDITEREWFVHSLPGNNNERLFHFEEVAREGSRILNRWFNEDLLWNDFVIADDAAGGDLVIHGRVGAFTGNWDFPYRANPGFVAGMQDHVGPEANFIPIAPFRNDAGEVRMFFPAPIDRHIFFPTTNTEPLASLLYLDFISRPDVLDFLQFGFEGMHYEVLADGSIATLAETDENPFPNNKVFPVLRNFDLTMTVNGIHFMETDLERALGTLALGYPGIEPERIISARELGLDHAYWFRNVLTRGIASEEGMIAPLIDARETLLQVVIAGTSPEDFDAVFDSMYRDYLSLGAALIMEEREQAWIETFGDVDQMPH